MNAVINQSINKQKQEDCKLLFSSFPLLLAFDVGGLGFEFCMFVAGWRHALRSEWPFIIIIANPELETEPVVGPQHPLSGH